MYEIENLSFVFRAQEYHVLWKIRDRATWTGRPIFCHFLVTGFAHNHMVAGGKDNMARLVVANNARF
jgi:hypothetical protein